jgi:hypothetical protein
MKALEYIYKLGAKATGSDNASGGGGFPVNVKVAIDAELMNEIKTTTNKLQKGLFVVGGTILVATVLNRLLR